MQAEMCKWKPGTAHTGAGSNAALACIFRPALLQDNGFQLALASKGVFQHTPQPPTRPFLAAALRSQSVMLRDLQQAWDCWAMQRMRMMARTC